jgi:aldehyde dehydrogenase family protein
MPSQDTATTTVGDSPSTCGSDSGSAPHPDRRLLIDGRLISTDRVLASINPADSPFGGFKQCGVGREMGVAGLEEFLERKTFAVPAVPVPGVA